MCCLQTTRVDVDTSSKDHYRSVYRKRPLLSKGLTLFQSSCSSKSLLTFLYRIEVFGYLPSLLIDLQCQPHCRLSLRSLEVFYLDSLSTTLDRLSGLFWYAFSFACLFYFTLEYSPIRSSVRQFRLIYAQWCTPHFVLLASISNPLGAVLDIELIIIFTF